MKITQLTFRASDWRQGNSISPRPPDVPEALRGLEVFNEVCSCGYMKLGKRERKDRPGAPLGPCKRRGTPVHRHNRVPGLLSMNWFGQSGLGSRIDKP